MCRRMPRPWSRPPDPAIVRAMTPNALPDPTPTLPSRNRVAVAVLVAAVALLMGLAVVAYPRLERFFLIQAGDRSAPTLQLATQSLRSALSRTEALPALIAERQILTALLRDPTNSGLVPFVNEQLRQTALSLDVSDVYLMDADGQTIAASNYRSDTSFVGRNFAFRPYTIQALSGGLGRFHALGTTSGQRGYFFAAPVIDGTEITGAVSVKITIDAFETAWANSPTSILVTDISNVVFMSDRADWRYRTLGPMSEAALEEITTTRQYPIDALTPLPLRRAPLEERFEIVTLENERFVMQTDLVAAAGWRVSILSPAAPAQVQAVTVLVVAGLAALFLLLVATVIWQRRMRLMKRIARQHRDQALLEQRVTERTADLDSANAQLRQEVEDRRRAEDRLRRTQAELVQAGKLAALGQMSAALSHEFNQPLAAVKAYAENAGTFLERGRVSDARENITRISGMADRMASISKHLRNFARRPQDKTGPVPLRGVLEDAVELMRPRLDADGAMLHYTPPEAEVWVNGGRVRLQQVIVNLIGNALDAMAEREPPEIALAVSIDGTRACVTVADRGPGLAQEALAQAFDPFFTTKDPGKGLGLGLSISYNIVRDFNGRLSVTNREGGGAAFTVELDRVDPPSEMAAE
jgi:two-component system C4-dicarboxylate transport sensor histidine kinase DctB